MCAVHLCRYVKYRLKRSQRISQKQMSRLKTENAELERRLAMANARAREQRGAESGYESAPGAVDLSAATGASKRLSGLLDTGAASASNRESGASGLGGSSRRLTHGSSTRGGSGRGASGRAGGRRKGGKRRCAPPPPSSMGRRGAAAADHALVGILARAPPRAPTTGVCPGLT